MCCSPFNSAYLLFLAGEDSPPYESFILPKWRRKPSCSMLAARMGVSASFLRFQPRGHPVAPMEMYKMNQQLPQDSEQASEPKVKLRARSSSRIALLGSVAAVGLVGALIGNGGLPHAAFTGPAQADTALSVPAN